jgi:uncharacterized Zn-binding protein involved in type VI secretion
MPALPVVRLGVDLCTGHPGPGFFESRPAIAGSQDVTVDGIFVVRVGDLWAPHTNRITIHPGTGISGSPTVFANGLPIQRVTDLIDCGSACMMGSSTVFSG